MSTQHDADKLNLAKDIPTEASNVPLNDDALEAVSGGAAKSQIVPQGPMKPGAADNELFSLNKVPTPVATIVNSISSLGDFMGKHVKFEHREN